MPEGQVLEFSHVTKRFAAVTAVSDFSARIEPGEVTGFLGPNGAGKTTSLRMLLGLIRPTSGSATIGGKRYSELKNPLQTVGSALEASSFHPGRTGANHLKVYARAAGIPGTRVDEVLGLVGLSDAAGRKVGGYSLGMRQRLGLATALLGDPGVLVLDEPANGLDPEGIRWMRGFLRQLAAEGRTVLVSSHVLGEVQQTAQSLLIIAHGQRVFQGALWELSAADEHAVVVDSPDRAALVEALRAAGLDYEVLRAGLTIRGADTAEIGAVVAGIALSTLHRRGPALEEVFLELVNGLRVHPSAQGIAGSLEAGKAGAEAAPEGTSPDATLPPEASAAPDLAADARSTPAAADESTTDEPAAEGATSGESSDEVPAPDEPGAAEAVIEDPIPAIPEASAPSEAATVDDTEATAVAEADAAEPPASESAEEASAPGEEPSLDETPSHDPPLLEPDPHGQPWREEPSGGEELPQEVPAHEAADDVRSDEDGEQR